jgi:hypothetical protein
MSDSSYVLPILAKLSSRFDSSDYKLLDIRGIPQNPSFIVSKFEDIIDSFQTRDGDVFISTFVKAGIMPDTSSCSVLLPLMKPCPQIDESRESHKVPFHFARTLYLRQGQHGLSR